MKKELKKELNIKDIPKPYSYQSVGIFFHSVYYEESRIRLYFTKTEAKDITLLLNAAFREGWIKHLIYGND